MASERTERRAKRSRRRLWCLAMIGTTLTSLCHSATGLEYSVARIHGDQSRALLGTGTDVIVGVIDSGVDATHPLLAGVDSKGRSRLVAAKNFVTSEPGNSPDDAHGHGTAIASVIAGKDAVENGLVPDARFVNGRVLNSSNRFDDGSWVENGVGFAIEQQADVLNLSLNYFSTGDSSSRGVFSLDRMLDWAAVRTEHPVLSAVCVGNISQGEAQGNTPRSPAGAYNVLTVAHSQFPDYGRSDPDAARGPTSDGRLKPDLVAPGSSILAAYYNWEQGPKMTEWSGCSFATPHVAGVAAQLVAYGRAQGLSTDPMVIKATLMNGAEKIRNDRNQAWSPANSEVVGGVWQSSSPLDKVTGAGQVDALASALEYIEGEQSPGATASLGWDLGNVTDTNANDYTFTVRPGEQTMLNATLTWMRHVVRTDQGEPGIGAFDSYSVDESGDGLDNLDLVILRNGQPVARSQSTVDNVEHLHWSIDQAGDYTVRVIRQAVANSGNSAQYAVAWHVTGFWGDIDANGVLDVRDIDRIAYAAANGKFDAAFDLNDDAVVDRADFVEWVETAKKTYFGDANLDGVFSTDDLVAVFQPGTYEDSLPDNSTWATGDWNADLDFDTSDLVVAFQDGGYDQGPRAATPVVPEPNSIGWLMALVGSIVVGATYRRRR